MNNLLKAVHKMNSDRIALQNAVEDLAKNFLSDHNLIEPIDGYELLSYTGFDEYGEISFEGTKYLRGCSDDEYSFGILPDDLLDEEKRQSYFVRLQQRVDAKEMRKVLSEKLKDNKALSIAEENLAKIKKKMRNV